MTAPGRKIQPDDEPVAMASKEGINADDLIALLIEMHAAAEPMLKLLSCLDQEGKERLLGTFITTVARNLFEGDHAEKREGLTRVLLIARSAFDEGRS